MNELGDIGGRIKLHTHLHVREDNLSLYGFLSENERKVFQSLIGVSGVGPKVALGILSVTGADELAHLISRAMTDRLVAFPGIGRKTAERIVLELKDKLKIEAFEPVSEEVEKMELEKGIYEEALDVLESLGISKQNAAKALIGIKKEELGKEYGVEDVIKLALAKFAGRVKSNARG
jgi:Holliday junction DNA helicase RuvA